MLFADFICVRFVSVYLRIDVFVDDGVCGFETVQWYGPLAFSGSCFCLNVSVGSKFVVL